jgi:hypothetical protein
MAITLIEGLPASLKFAVWTLEQLNQSAEMPVEIKAIAQSLEFPYLVKPIRLFRILSAMQNAIAVF